MGYEIRDIRLENLSRNNMRSLHKILEDVITPEERKTMPASFDVIGNIAILDIPPTLRNKEKEIAKKVLETFKNITTIARREGIHEGEFRTRKVKILAGKRTKTTIHKESGIILKINVEKCYFSPRYGTERLRIASQVKEGERVLVMFSGVGPFPLVIAKNSKPSQVIGVEKNPECHKLALENKTLNKKAGKITEFFKGDVKEILPLIGLFDRIAMPLPKGGEEFLDYAIESIKKGGTIHFYDFASPDTFEYSQQKIIDSCKKIRRKCRIIQTTKCGEIKPRTYRICIDAKIE